MSMRDHELIEQLLAVRSLGGLEPEDDAALEAAMAEHGPECAECRRLQDALGETAGLLGFALDPVPVPDDLADRIVHQAQDARETRRTRRGLLAVAVAASLVVVVAGVATFRPRTQPITGATPAQQVIRFEGGPGALAMAFIPDQPGALIWGEGLPSPGADKTYEIWMITGATPVSAGCVVPTNGELATYTDADVSTSDVMAVTVESTSCPGAPTTQPVYTAALS